MIDKPKIPKKETKEQRVKRHAEIIFARMMGVLTDMIAKAPKESKFSPQEIKAMANNRVMLAIDAAAFFEETWQSQKGRFIEEEIQ